MKFIGTVKLSIEYYEFLKDKAETVNRFEQQLMRLVKTKRKYEITPKTYNDGSDVVILKEGTKSEEILNLVLSTFIKNKEVYNSLDEAKNALDKKWDDKMEG